jgi:hypothetical protein
MGAEGLISSEASGNRRFRATGKRIQRIRSRMEMAFGKMHVDGGLSQIAMAEQDLNVRRSASASRKSSSQNFMAHPAPGRAAAHARFLKVSSTYSPPT